MTITHDIFFYRALEVLSLMRTEEQSLHKASRRVGIDPRTVISRVGQALTFRRGRWHAKPRDRLPRRVRMLDARGNFEIEIRDSRQVSVIAAYWNAVYRFLEKGDEKVLEPFVDLEITAGPAGEIHKLITDPQTLIRLAMVGEVQFEDRYAQL